MPVGAGFAPGLLRLRHGSGCAIPSTWRSPIRPRPGGNRQGQQDRTLPGLPPGLGLIALREVVGMAPLAPHLRDHYAIQAIPETCLPGEGASPFCGVLRVVAARRRLCRAAGPGASPHARLARQREEQSGERRPEGAALNKYGNSNHTGGPWPHEQGWCVDQPSRRRALTRSVIIVRFAVASCGSWKAAACVDCAGCLR